MRDCECASRGQMTVVVLGRGCASLQATGGHSFSFRSVWWVVSRALRHWSIFTGYRDQHLDRPSLARNDRRIPCSDQKPPRSSSALRSGNFGGRINHRCQCLDTERTVSTPILSQLRYRAKRVMHIHHSSMPLSSVLHRSHSLPYPLHFSTPLARSLSLLLPLSQFPRPSPNPRN